MSEVSSISGFDCRLDPEERLVLLLSGPIVKDEALATAKKILDNTVDFEKFLGLAAMNGVSAIIYDNVKSLQLLPEEVTRRLQNFYFLTFKDNVHQSRETMKILDCLQKRGVEAISLKGAIASDVVFENIGIYPTSDIDILVLPDAIQRAVSALEEIGYRKTTDLSDGDLFNSTYHYCYAKDNFVVELHWGLVMRYFDAPHDFWWEDRTGIRYEGSEILSLSAERYLLYAVFRLFSHAFRPLRFSVFVSGLLFRYGEKVDWEKLVACSEILGMKRLVLFTFQLMRDIHGNLFPFSMVDKRVWGYHFLKKFVISGFFDLRGRNRLRMLVFLLLLDSPLQILRVALRRIFPSTGEVRWRYGLPAKSKKVYVYYALNPLLMLLKRY